MGNFVFISPHFPSTYRKFCRALKNRGWNVLGVGDAPYNEIPNECKEALTEYYCCPNMNDYENEKKAVKYFIDKYGNIDYLESNNEYWLEKDARLREEFGIKSGATIEEVKFYRYKSLQKEYFIKAGLKTARFIVPTTESEIDLFVKIVGFPIFIKPNNGVGAQGSKKIKNLAELDKNKKIIIQNQYIIEEYVDGSIVSFDGICDDNSNVVFATTNVFMVDNCLVVTDGLDDAYYCNPYIDEEFLDIGKNVIKSFGLKKRFFHIEFFILKSNHDYLGQKGSIIPLEANMRPAGGYTPDLINYANSVSVYDIYADIITDNKTNYDRSLEKYYAITSSRRKNLNYLYSNEEIFNKYMFDITMYGEYPESIADDMGDYYFFARFKELDEAKEFDRFVRSKK